jgi:hypothetical protein
MQYLLDVSYAPTRRRAPLFPPLPRGCVSGKEAGNFGPSRADSIGCGGIAVFSAKINGRSSAVTE